MAGRAVAKALDMGEGLDESEGIPKKSKAKKIVIFLSILIMMGAMGGGGWYWWFFIREPVATDGSVEAGENSKNASADSMQGQGAPDMPRIERKSTLPRSTGVVVPLPEFVVNISGPEGKRYLKIGMEVEANSDISEQIKLNNAKIRDAVIILLAGKTYADVSSVEGKIMLKTEVAARLNQILGAQRIVRVYFTQFVVE